MERHLHEGTECPPETAPGNRPDPQNPPPEPRMASVSNTEAPAGAPKEGTSPDLSDGDRQWLLDQLLSRAVGGSPPPVEAVPATPIVNVLAAFEARLRFHDEDTEEHVDCVMRRLKKVIHVAKWVTVEDITEQSCDLAIATIRATTAGRRGRATISKRTVNNYLQAIKQFTRWLSRRAKLLSQDPLVGVDKLSIKDSDQTFSRRALTADEFVRLYEAAFYGPTIETIPGPDRAMLYLAAAYTGFRKTECGSLTKEHFLVELGRVTVEAGYSKNGRRDTQILADGIVKLLSQWLKQKKPDALLWPVSGLKQGLREKGGKTRKTHRMITKDCERAKIPYKTLQGLVDFHALRHTYITNLSRVVDKPKIVQQLARHSDLKLTMEIYTHVRREDEEEAVAKLPAPVLGAQFN